MLSSELLITVPKMPTLFLVWSLIAIPVIAALYCIGFLFKRADLEKYYVLPKCAASFLCVGSAVLAVLLSGGHPFHHPLFWALIFCLLGDFLIEYQIIAGGLSFAIGHCILIVYALSIVPPRLPAILLWIAGVVIVVLIFKKEIPQMGKLFLPFLIYVTILVGDLATAVMLPSVHAGFIAYAAGLACFVTSDVILGKRQFGHDHPALPKILMALYYAALYLIAASLWFTLS